MKLVSSWRFSDTSVYRSLVYSADLLNTSITIMDIEDNSQLPAKHMSGAAPGRCCLPRMGYSMILLEKQLPTGYRQVW